MGADGPGADLELALCRLQQVSLGTIGLGQRDAACVVGPTETDTGDPEGGKAPLSEIIERLNERFGTNFTEADRYIFEQVKAQAVSDETVRETVRANPLDGFRLGVWDRILKLMVERMSENDALVRRYLEQPEFPSVAYDVLAREIFAALR